MHKKTVETLCKLVYCFLRAKRIKIEKNKADRGYSTKIDSVCSKKEEIFIRRLTVQQCGDLL